MSTFVNAPLHDMLIRIKNAYMGRKTNIDNVQYSSLKENVLKLLKEHGFILDYSIVEDGKKKFISITVKEVTNSIQDVPVIKFHSKPSRRLYVSYKELHKVA
jgi:small subunit ribosomal protein S8